MSRKNVLYSWRGLILLGFVVFVSAAVFLAISSSSISFSASGPGPSQLTFEKSGQSSEPTLMSDLFMRIAEEIEPSVVNVSSKIVVRPSAENEQGQVPDQLRRFFGEEFFERFFGPRVPQTRQSLGSGVIVDPEGYLLTNHHVVAPLEQRGVRQIADQIEVQLSNGDSFAGRVIGTDPESDIAVLKIDADQSLTAPKIGDSSELRVGEWVMAIGSPFGLEHTVTTGIVSATQRVVPTGIFGDYIQTDAAINPGNSGGPLINLQGQLVGINTFIATTSGSFAGVGFAVPSSIFVSSYNQLISDGKIERGWLGVSMNGRPMTPEMAEFFGVAGKDPNGIKDGDGALVTELIDQEGNLSDQGPAAEAGIQSGDVIVKFAQKEIETNWDLRSAVANTDPNQKVPVTIVRKGKPMTLEVELGRRTLEEQERASAEGMSLDEEEKEPREIGIEFRSLNEKEIQQLDLEENQGVVVLGVAPGSLAEEAGLSSRQIITHVNGTSVDSARAFKNAVEKVPSGEGVVLRVIAVGPEQQKNVFYTSFVKP